MSKKEKKEWFNDEEFWQVYAPVMFDERRWSEVPAVSDAVTRLAGLKLYKDLGKSKGKKTAAAKSTAAKSTAAKSKASTNSLKPKVLDLCCGFGRITLELARRGFNATGVDLCRSYLETAKENALQEKLEIDFIENDVRSYKSKEAFDLVINLYNSFGYFENPDDDFILVKNAFNSLKAGGAFIIDVLGKEIAVRDYNEAEWFERAGYMVLTETNPLDSWSSIWNRWILITNNKHWEKELTQRLYSASELRSLLYKAGFAIVEIYGNWDEGEYNQHAQSLIAVARKAPSVKSKAVK